MFEALIREKEEQAIVIQEKNMEILRLKDIIRLLEINADNKDKIWMMHFVRDSTLEKKYVVLLSSNWPNKNGSNFWKPRQ